MGRFIFWFFLFLLAGGIALHLGVQIPWVSTWLGHLPGDLAVQKDKLTIYFPITSAALASVVISFVASLFSRKEK